MRLSAHPTHRFLRLSRWRGEGQASKMPGRLRKRDTLSDKAEGACAKCCQACCHFGLHVQALCCLIIIVFVVGFLVWLIGAAIVGPAASNLGRMSVCRADAPGQGSSSGNDTATGATTAAPAVAVADPTVPLSRQNLYAWYLANSGIFFLLMIFASCICCGSFFGLCCGDFPRGIKICSTICCVLVLLVVVIFVGWIALGSYLLSTYRPTSILVELCRNTAIYVVLFYCYLVVFVALSIAACVWKFVDLGKQVKTKSKPSKV